MNTALKLMCALLIAVVAVLSDSTLLSTSLSCMLALALGDYLLVKSLPTLKSSSDWIYELERRLGSVLMTLAPATLPGLLIFGAVVTIAVTQMSSRAAIMTVAIYLFFVTLLVVLCSKLKELANQKHSEEHQRSHRSSGDI